NRRENRDCCRARAEQYDLLYPAVIAPSTTDEAQWGPDVTPVRRPVFRPCLVAGITLCARLSVIRRTARERYSCQIPASRTRRPTRRSATRARRRRRL